MKLIIAEKPSLGRNIAAALGEFKKRDGYLEGKDCLISWAFGHLFSLADIEYYNPRPEGCAHWSMDNLPCFPSEFKYELRRDKDGQADGGIVKQFKILETLCNRADVDVIVNAGDADREGEIIVRNCITHALRSPKPIKRLWLPDQTPETVSSAFADMKDDAETYRAEMIEKICETDDELLEITPKNLRIRKKILDKTLRAKAKARQ